MIWTQLTFCLSCLIQCTSPTLEHLPKPGYNQEQGWQITLLEEREGGKKEEFSSLLQWTRVYVRLGLTVQDRVVANSASTAHGYQTPAVTSHFQQAALLSQPATKCGSDSLRSLVWSYSVGPCPRTVCTAPVGGVSAAVRPAGPPCRVRAATQGPRPPLQTRDRGYFTTSTRIWKKETFF